MGFLDSKIATFGDRQILKMQNSVNFAIITKDNQIALAMQKRAGDFNRETLNLFGGYIEEDENFINAGLREAYEEANVYSADIQRIDCIYENLFVSVGYTTERNSLLIIYLNKNKNELDLRCIDENERIDIVYIGFNQIQNMIRDTNCMKSWIFAKTMEERLGDSI